MRVTIATDAETRLWLKQLAALRGMTMEGALRELVRRAMVEELGNVVSRGTIASPAGRCDG